MALNLNAMMITSKSKSLKSSAFALSLPLPKPRSTLFTYTVLPYKSNVIDCNLHLETAGTSSNGDAVPAKKYRKGKILAKSLCYAKKTSVGQLNSTGQVPLEKAEIFKSMESWATTNILPLLKPVEECWQPQDFLPDPASEEFHDQLREIRARTEQIPDDYFVVLVGDMITEEALPSYQSRLNGTNFFHDQTGVDQTPWAIWSRGWSAEENRHGDLLNKYLYLSGRVDMKHVETTIQYLIGSGMDIGTGSNPYLLTIYTSFQERATAISHGNTAKLAVKHGDIKLAQICGTIASDEKRHETAYSKIAEKLFELDPNDMVVAFADMMRRKISMPAHFMYDGCDDNLFQHFSNVASRIGVYTATDYRKILEHLVDKWHVERLTGLSSDGREAQDYVCGLAQRFKRLEERAQAKAQSETPPVSFSWIYGRQV